MVTVGDERRKRGARGAKNAGSRDHDEARLGGSPRPLTSSPTAPQSGAPPTGCGDESKTPAALRGARPTGSGGDGLGESNRPRPGIPNRGRPAVGVRTNSSATSSPESPPADCSLHSPDGKPHPWHQSAGDKTYGGRDPL